MEIISILEDGKMLLYKGIEVKETKDVINNSKLFIIKHAHNYIKFSTKGEAKQYIDKIERDYQKESQRIVKEKLLLFLWTKTKQELRYHHKNNK